ncbi:MAG: hypothetical protein QCI82_01995 [Candidatus Thermoplasmatota archaeon]|nr:hypothetical protein [Candidatus Thermoplasmatota archaeon]
MENDTKRIIGSIYQNIKRNDYKGYDPYDCLNSPIITSFENRWIRIASTQLLVYSPINFRSILRIKKDVNPKTMGLLLRALLILKKGKDHDIIPDLEKEIEFIHSWIIENQNMDYSGPCWGYHFPWQDLHKFIPRYEPSIVVTSFIGHSLIDLYNFDANPELKRTISGIADFIMNDLNIHKDDEGICFSYSPHDNNVVHNANILGSSYLFRAGTVLKKDDILEIAEKALNFTLSKQNADGSWYYSIDPSTGKFRKQFDFHQGFILDGLRSIWEIDKDERILPRIEKGLRFYIKTIDDRGRTYYRYPRKWPIDIHNQAQAMITLKDNSSMFPFVRDKFEKVLSWTLKRMIRSDGRTRHQVWPIIKNNNDYTRWGDSWILLALVKCLGNGDHR